MLLNWIRFMRGYVLIKLSGYAPERFLNLCSNHNIFVWDIEKQGACFLMKMSIGGFRRVRPIVRKTKTKIMILEKHGLPFFIFKNRKRKAFFAGMLMSAVLLYAMSLFVWDIRVEGSVRYTQDMILELLEDNHISHGMKKSDVNGEDIQFLLRDAYPGITWASVSMEGTRLLIQIKESILTDEKVFLEQNTSDHIPGTDLVSPVDGVITDMIVRRGTPVKRIGESASHGEVLVSGRLDIVNDYKEVVRYEYCEADADIYMEYEKACSFVQERNYKKTVYSGELKKGYFFKFGAHDIFLKPQLEDEKTYDRKTEIKQFRLLDHFYLPVYWGYVEYRQYDIASAIYDEEEIRGLLETELQEELRDLEKKGVQIIENSVKIQIDKSRGVASGHLLVREKVKEVRPTEVLPDPVISREASEN